ncbi:MAG: hypothetical protein IPN74_01810 [Haliscomenobacter sp.]|nr:hypothetical protein [Haliscomenobacter sp.]
MEQLVLNQLKLLPEHLQIEALHYIQYLLFIKNQEEETPIVQESPLTFSDFHFPESGQTYSRAEIYGDNGR